MAYLITCSGSKQNPTIINPSSIEALSFNKELLDARIKMIRLNNIELNWDKTLPAWKLYSGSYSRFYPHIVANNWHKPNANIMILSALFGWVKLTDLIPYYDLKMDKKINDQFYVWQIWNHFNVLPQLISDTDIDLLSPNYRKAICGKNKSIAIKPDVHFVGRGDQQGRWLNEQLNRL
jgi:cytoplasmic iron level regulating protein YaaA (DUF328/UPF0246 family)